jgi:hypothetical protein
MRLKRMQEHSISVTIALCVLFYIFLPVVGMNKEQSLHVTASIEPVIKTEQKEYRDLMWRENVAFLDEVIVNVHPNPFYSIEEEEYRKAVSKLRRNIPILNDEEMFVEMKRIVASLKDGHTWFNKRERNFLFPFTLKWYEYNLVVVVASSEHKDLLGSKLKSIEGVSIEEVYDKLQPLIESETDEWKRALTTWDLMDAEILKGLRVIEDKEKAIFEFETANGDHIQRYIKSESLNSMSSISFTDYRAKEVPLYLQYGSFHLGIEQYYWHQYLENEKTLYLQFNSYNDRHDEYPLYKFEQEIINILKGQDVKKVVIDLRHNSGGRPGFFSEIEKELRMLTKKKDVSFYVITGYETFSAAVISVNRYKSFFGATVVGESTGGVVQTYGTNYSEYVLPHFDLVISPSIGGFSTVVTKEERINEIQPDVYIPTTYGDFITGHDPVLSFIVND